MSEINKHKTSLATEIFGRIWAAWGLLVFIPTLLIAVIPITFSFLIPEPYGVRTFKAISKVWMTIFLNSIGCPLRIKNKHYFNPKKNYVVCCNHSSFLDVPIITPFFPGPNKTIAKKSFSYIPFFGWIYTRGSVLVDRSNDRSRKKSYDAMKHVLLEEHLNMALYPEGTRNRTGQPLKSFYDGAFRLAVDCKKEIIPVVIFNSAEALPPTKPFFLLPKKLEMHLLEPISNEGKTAAELKQVVFDTMWKYIEENKKSV